MNPISSLFRFIHWPIARAYARYILRDNPSDRVMAILCSLYFWEVHGYWPHLKNPRSFSEKVWNRMLYDRDPHLTIVTDKLRVRDYVAKKVGNKYLVPLLWNGEDANGIPFDKLPTKFVIKVNHGCHYNIIVKDKSRLEQPKVLRQLKKWVKQNYCQDKFLGVEWGYKNIKPSIIVESFLDDHGNVPIDYKFRCFSGRTEFLTLQFDRPGDNPLILVCDRNCDAMECVLGTKYTGKYERPGNFEEMVQVAEALAEDFDFMRVDLYSLDGKVYFGELTPYPSAGVIRFVPRHWDFLFGEKWKNIKEHN